MNTNPTTIEKRDYSKKELAIMCNPGMDADAASQKFYRDVYGCTKLMSILKRRGFRKYKHTLSYWQVKLILEYVYPEMFEIEK